MAQQDNGSLYFKSELDNEQIISAVEEAKRSIKGLSSATISGGELIDESFLSSAKTIREAMREVDQVCDLHLSEIRKLEQAYKDLEEKSGAAFLAGKDNEYRAIEKKKDVIHGELRVRKAVVAETQKLNAILEKENTTLQENRDKAEKAAMAKQSLRIRIRELTQEMAAYRSEHGDQTEEYRRMSAELGRLMDIRGDIARQGNILSNDQANFQGIIAGLSGLAGGFSAATGAMSLFAGENEDLQKVMTRVQSVMAITIGLQQVSQALNKDSAFRLVTINKLKGWWHNITLKATMAESAEAAATVANTAAKSAESVAVNTNTVDKVSNTAVTNAGTAASTTGAVANWTLAASFRAVGLAIKSIPVFGWVIAGISALVALVGHFSQKAKEAKKKQEEFTKAMVEGCYKPIGEIERLSRSYTKLGNDIKAKERFINDNRDAFDELGVKIRSVAEAENLLIKNKEAFIDAQVSKARALAYTKLNEEKIQSLVQKEDEYKRIPDTVKSDKTLDIEASTGMEIPNLTDEKKLKLKAEIEQIRKELKEGYENIEREDQKAKESLKKAGIRTVEDLVEGSVEAIDKAISDLQEKLKDATNRKEAKKIQDDIEKLEKQKDSILGKKSESKEKDPFVEALEKRKRSYAEFLKWVNSDDESVRNSAKKQFASILKEGETYVEYLKNQRDQLLSVGNRTQEQNKNLASLNTAIAEESKRTLIEVFDEGLKMQLEGVDTVIEKLDVIKKAKDNLSGDDPLREQKSESLENALQAVEDQARKETRALYQEYASYYEKRVALHTKYLNDIKLLEDAKKSAGTKDEQQKYQEAIDNRKRKYDKDLKGVDGYDEMIKAYGDFEKKKQAIIDSYEEKRRVARERNDEDMLRSLDNAEAKDISSLATGELTKSEAWTNLFGNLDELTAKQIDTLVAEIESKFDDLSKHFNPIDIDKIREKLNEAKDILLNENPFKAVGDSISAIFAKSADGSKDSANDIKRNWKNLAQSTEKSFAFVKDAIDSADFLKDAIGEVGEAAINSLSVVASTSIAVAAAIKTAERASVVLAVIQAALVVVQAVVNVVKQIAGNKDKKIQRQIEGHARAVEDLRRAYGDLERSINKALGGDKFKKQKAAIENLKAQEKQLQEMERKERKKKKTDEDKVREYQEQQREAQRRREKMVEEMRTEILGTDAKDAAQQLGDAFIDAFARGEDAVKAFGKKADEIVANIMRKMLIKKLLEEPMGKIIDKYAKRWVDDDGNFKGFDTVLNDTEGLGNELKALAKGFGEKGQEVLKKLSDMSGLNPNATSLTGAIKGVTEETASVVAGQLNAIRMSQAESADILRRQLLHLSEIASNTKYCKHLESIDRKMSNIGGGALRAKGLSV